jgi:hypothetical protein
MKKVAAILAVLSLLTLGGTAYAGQHDSYASWANSAFGWGN